MSARFVNIHTGVQGRSDLISFSNQISESPDKPGFTAFLAQRGYEWNDIGNKSMSRFVEVRPPLTDLHVYELGILCVGGKMLDNSRVNGIVDGYHDEVVIVDTRSNHAQEPIGIRRVSGGMVIAEA